MAADTFQNASNGDHEDGHLIRVLLADDHALVREGTRRLLEAENDVEVVAEAARGEEAIDAAKRLHPDIAIMDIAMPGIGGIDATRAIKVCSPETAVLVLSAYDDEPYLMAILEAGAAGFLLKNVHGQELINAIRAVSRGESVLHPTDSPHETARMALMSSRSEEHTSELQSPDHLVCRLLLYKKK